MASNNNTLGECCCQDQIFMSEDCRQGFYCTSQHPGYQGCAIQAILTLPSCCVKNRLIFQTSCNTPWTAVYGRGQCREWEHLVIDPRVPGWVCQPPPAGPVPQVCPGALHTQCGCPDCGVGECECSGQLRVSADCHYARYCNSTLPEDYQETECEQGEIVFVNLVCRKSWIFRYLIVILSKLR